MPSGPEAVLKFQKLFDQLGADEGTVMLRKVIPSIDAYADTASVPADTSLYKVIINDPEDRRSWNVQGADTKIFRIWGGAIDPVNFSRVVTEVAFAQARTSGGGIFYENMLYRITGVERGFAVGEYVTSFFIIAVTPVTFDS